MKSRSPSMEFDLEGISTSWPGHWRWQKPQVQKLRWADVKQVMTYKKDCYTIDQIRLEFLTDARDSVVITESMGSWSELVGQLPSLLPGFPLYETWFSKVALPPFETNLRPLYVKASSEAADKPGS